MAPDLILEVLLQHGLAQPLPERDAFLASPEDLKP